MHLSCVAAIISSRAPNTKEELLENNKVKVFLKHRPKACSADPWLKLSRSGLGHCLARKSECLGHFCGTPLKRKSKTPLQESNMNGKARWSIFESESYKVMWK